MTARQIDESIEKNELQLSKWGAFTHYGIVGMLLFIPTMILFLYLTDALSGPSNEFKDQLVWFIVVPVALALLFYKLQKHRLKFLVVETNLRRDELDKIIQLVSEELKWKIITTSTKIVVAKTYPRFTSGSWGEQITILFDNQRVLVNSICDLDKQSSVVSMGRNRKNMNRLIDEIVKESR